MGAQPYRHLDDVALADIAFEAEGETLASLFEACALATTEPMAESAGISPRLSARPTPRCHAERGPVEKGWGCCTPSNL